MKIWAMILAFHYFSPDTPDTRRVYPEPNAESCVAEIQHAAAVIRTSLYGDGGKLIEAHGGPTDFKPTRPFVMTIENRDGDRAEVTLSCAVGI